MQGVDILGVGGIRSTTRSGHSAAAGGPPEHPQVHSVVASAAREVLNKSENERSGVPSSAMSFLILYRDPIVTEIISRCGPESIPTSPGAALLRVCLVIQAKERGVHVIDRRGPLGANSKRAALVAASLRTGLNSDLPGIVIAQVIENATIPRPAEPFSSRKAPG